MSCSRLEEIKRQIGLRRIVLTVILPHWRPNTLAARVWIRWASRCTAWLDGWLCSSAATTTQSPGDWLWWAGCCIVWLHAWLCSSVATAAQSSVYPSWRSCRTPCSFSPFARMVAPILSRIISLYQFWAIRPHLSLLCKKVFSGTDHVRIHENTRWVRVLADLLPRQAWTRLISYILLFTMLVWYQRELHTLSKSLCRWYAQENLVRQSHRFSCLLSTYSIWPRESGAPRITMSISGSSIIPVSYWKKVLQLGCTNLLSVWGAYQSILFHQVVNPAGKRSAIFRELV